MKKCFFLAWILLTMTGCNPPIESGLIYFPSREIFSTPSDAGLEYEEVRLRTQDGVLISAWYLPCEGAKATMLWFHGNAGNIGDRVGHLQVYHDQWQVNQMIVEYRGYGKSEGTTTEEGTYEDGRAAVRYLMNDKKVTAEQLVLFGRSLGAAVALQMAVEFPCTALILESPFASVREMAKKHYPLLGHLFPLRIHYDSIGKIGKIHVPLLILHGDQDRIVPLDQGKRLFDSAPEPKKFFTIRGAGHNDVLSKVDESYHETVRSFIHDIRE